MNDEIKDMIEASERRAEEIKADSKMHNLNYNMAVDNLTLCRLLRQAYEVIATLEKQGTAHAKQRVDDNR